MRLYGYWRSSCSWVVRACLNHKGIAFEHAPVHLKDGAQHAAAHTAINLLAQVPVLQWREGEQTRRLSQSMAILEYLEERFPEAPLLPADPERRSRARELSLLVNAGIQPLQNLYTLQRVNALEQDGRAFGRHFIERGLAALERQVQHEAGPFLLGERPCFADLYLLPQLYNARRFQVDLQPHARLRTVEKHCGTLPAWRAARPEAQPDADPDASP